MKKSEWKTPSEEEMAHWTPTGAAPMVIWMDGPHEDQS